MKNLKAAVAALAAGAVVGVGGVATYDEVTEPAKPSASPEPKATEPVVKPKVTADKIALVVIDDLNLEQAQERPFIWRQAEKFGYAQNYDATLPSYSETVLDDAKKSGREVHRTDADSLGALARRAELAELGNIELVTVGADDVKAAVKPILDGKQFASGKLAVLLVSADGKGGLLSVLHETQKANLVDVPPLSGYGVQRTLHEIAATKPRDEAVAKAPEVHTVFALPIDGCA